MSREKKIVLILIMMWGFIIGIPQFFIAGYSGSAAFAFEKPRFAKREILDTLYSPKRNSMTTTRLMAMLANLLAEQKRVFLINYGGKKNPTPAKVEELLNQANFSAAQQKYDEAFETFHEAYDVLMESLEESPQKD
jgi:hypothetical protein